MQRPSCNYVTFAAAGWCRWCVSNNPWWRTLQLCQKWLVLLHGWFTAKVNFASGYDVADVPASGAIFTRGKNSRLFFQTVKLGEKGEEKQLVNVFAVCDAYWFFFWAFFNSAKVLTRMGIGLYCYNINIEANVGWRFEFKYKVWYRTTWRVVFFERTSHKYFKLSDLSVCCRDVLIVWPWA